MTEFVYRPRLPPGGCLSNHLVAMDIAGYHSDAGRPAGWSEDKILNFISVINGRAELTPIRFHLRGSLSFASQVKYLLQYKFSWIFLNKLKKSI